MWCIVSILSVDHIETLIKIFYIINLGHGMATLQVSVSNRQSLRQTIPVSEIAAEDGITLASDALAQLERENYPYAELSDGKCPVGVDPCSKEVHSYVFYFYLLFRISDSNIGRISIAFFMKILL